jgi:heterodisulfide reductase subunit B
LKKQDNECAICGIYNQWNGQALHFILDHIDGDASNNFEDNLRLICPNCDSQLDTYKSRNKNSARSHRKNY